jgi:hypothetical protein
MAEIVGSPYIDNDFYSQKQPFLNSSFHHDLFFMYSWHWMLAELRYCLFMVGQELQAFRICGRQQLAGQLLSP